MLTIGELIKDPCFCTKFTIIYRGGSFVRGVYKPVDKSVPVIGVARPSSADDLDLLPEGDRVKGSMSFYTNEPIIVTNTESAPLIKWHDRTYKIIHTEDFVESGFFKAIGTLMTGGGI